MTQQYFNELSHRRICRVDNSYMNTGQVFGTLRLTALKQFPQSVFSLHGHNNLKWVILGTLCACNLARIFIALKRYTVKCYDNCVLLISFNNSVYVHIIVYKVT